MPPTAPSRLDRDAEARHDRDAPSAFALAHAGTRDGGGALPHRERIQHAFGHHDLSAVQAHTDAAAAQANDALGARGYAFGSHVAFRGAPDLHTAAHEAAHVIQQRAGVALKDAVGRPGDAYERHADAVADRVVAGQSAEALLDRFSGPGGSSHAIQRRAIQFDEVPDRFQRDGGAARRGRAHRQRESEHRSEVVAAETAQGGRTVSGMVSEATESRAELRGVAVSFAIPGGRTLSSSWRRSVATRAGTQVHIAVEPSGLRVSMAPGLYIDAQWPARNMVLEGCGWDFARGEPSVSVRNADDVPILGGAIDYTDTARSEVRRMLLDTIGATPMGRAGYDPTNDPSLLAHVTLLRHRFEDLPPSPGAPAEAPRPSSPAISATLAMRTPYEQGAGNAALRIPGGGSFTATIQAGGDPAAVARAGSVGDRIAAARIQHIDLTSDAISLLSGGRPVATLEHLRITQGGNVTLLRFRSHGDARTGAGFEALVRLFVVGAAIEQGGGPSGAGALEAASRTDAVQPEVVPGMTRGMIEAGLSDAIRRLLQDNRHAVPGVDLASVFGVE